MPDHRATHAEMMEEVGRVVGEEFAACTYPGLRAEARRVLVAAVAARRAVPVTRRVKLPLVSESLDDFLREMAPAAVTPESFPASQQPPAVVPTPGDPPARVRTTPGIDTSTDSTVTSSF